MATGLGGILGCCIGGIMTQYFHPKYSFLLYSFFGLIVSFNGLYLTKASEEDAIEEIEEVEREGEFLEEWGSTASAEQADSGASKCCTKLG